MDFRILKKMFSDGLLSEALVVPAPFVQGEFNLVFITLTGNMQMMTLARRTDPKNYKSYTSAFNDAEKVGFKSVKVELDKMAL